MNDQDTSFEPKALHDYFIEITKRPHPSANQEGVTGNEDPVRQYVAEEAPKIGATVKFYNPDTQDPGQRVIVLSRPGSDDYKDKAPVILQAHMDMVYNPVNMEFPLQVIQDPDSGKTGRWIKAIDAKGTPCTLGADDGIGIATAMAILADENLKKYPVECLFTVQEETDMGGTNNCDLTKIGLTGNKLLNLDAETLNVIIYGSAGGAETSYQGNISRLESSDLDKYFPGGYEIKKVTVSGLRGGHSGVDINKGRLNAIKVLTQALARLNKRITNLDVSGHGIGVYNFLIGNIKRTDIIKANAIPASAEAIIALPKADADNFAKDFNAYCGTLYAQNLPEEAGFKFDAVPSTSSDQPLDTKSTDALLCMLQQIPHGVMTMIPNPDFPGVVETSTNLYNVAIKGSSVTIASSNRSSNDMALQALEIAQKSIGTQNNFMVFTDINNYSSWPPNADSALLKLAGGVYKGIYGEKYEETVIHAGLECGVLVKRFKDELGKNLDAISIGPTITNPHSPSESLQVETTDKTQTVQQFYNAVSQIIQAIFA
ncbi:MAG: peptidase dimerization domain-containing protein [Candidatus Omnitrophota bacterium]